tara:strand:- start:837 stop:1172 length:336 start_codon:yes stop_codon:yes gene_type:complete
MPNTIKEDKMAPIVIDFTQKEMIDESWLRMFGENIKGILKAMFGGLAIPVQVKGSTNDIRSFVEALKKEKSWIESSKRYGISGPRTVRTKAELDKAASEFQRATGIKWPFK